MLLPKSLSRVLSASVLLLGLANCAAKQAVKLGEIPQASAISADVVQETHYMVQSNFDNQGLKLHQSGPHYRRAQNILLRLEAAAEVKGFNYPLFIAEGDDTVNAMAVNGNTIVVYAELMRRVKEDPIVATVLAHEVAHIIAKHHEDDSSDKRAEALSVGSTILGTIVSVGAAVAGAGSLGSDLAGDAVEMTTEVVGTGALVRSYDRRLETEADEIGMMLMAKAGYDPNSAVTFWQNSAQIFGEKDGSEFFSTHPSGDSRQETLQQALTVAWPYYEAAKSNPLVANKLYEKSNSAYAAKAKTSIENSNVKTGSNVRLGANVNTGGASSTEAQMYQHIRHLYIKRGLPSSQAAKITTELQHTMSHFTPEQRRQSLQSMISTLEGSTTTR